MYIVREGEVVTEDAVIKLPLRSKLWILLMAVIRMKKIPMSFRMVSWLHVVLTISNNAFFYLFSCVPFSMHILCICWLMYLTEKILMKLSTTASVSNTYRPLTLALQPVLPLGVFPATALFAMEEFLYKISTILGLGQSQILWWVGFSLYSSLHCIKLLFGNNQIQMIWNLKYKHYYVVFIYLFICSLLRPTLT